MPYKNEDKILLILDVDETLVHATSTELGHQPDFKVFDYFIYKRPYLDEFLQEVKKDFLIGVWSSASDDYVTKVVEKIFPPQFELEFVWGRSRCTFRRNFMMVESRTYSTNMGDHYHYIKPLKKLKRRGYHLNKMLIVDDTPHKCQDNYGNAIYPNEFLGDRSDRELPLLARYLKSFKDMDSVRRVEKRNWQSRFKSTPK